MLVVIVGVGILAAELVAAITAALIAARRSGARPG
jgi:hypothetical protein